MSLLILFVMLFGSPGPPPTQTQPDVEAVKFSWRKLPGANAASAEKAQQMRIAQVDSMLGMEMRKDPKDWDHGAIARLEEEKQRLQQNNVTIDSFNHSNKAYEYKFKFKNHGKKEVAALVWSFVFTDSALGNVLVRLRFGSKAKLAAGKESGITAYADSSPPLVVDARAVTNGGKAWKETVIIEEIEFSDGTKWERSGS
jgi:hypothetical protein